MNKSFERKPIRHFFVKRSLQIRLIIHIVAAVFLTTLVSLGSMVLVYFIKYKTVIMYQLDQETQNLTHQSIISLILPSLLFSALVNLALAIGIGFYASRKYAIPIYKLEQWSSLLLQGRMTAVLQFREKEELKELSDKCNELTRFFRDRFIAIKRHIDELRKSPAGAEPAGKLEKTLEGLDLTTETIELNAKYFKAALDKERGKTS
jgi:glucan phosphoethanolaminetransferase (alkaline phosphatase superfamily)